MNLLEKAKYLLRTYQIHPKKSLGQNFMIEPVLFRKLADSASLDNSDVALDIGAGLGFLTTFLADECKTVLAVEADKTIALALREQTARFVNVKIIEGDILRANIPHFNKVVSIPPYNISSHLLLWLFSKQFDSAALIIQKEFAERLAAHVGSKDYGWLTVFANYHTRIQILDQVPKSAFYPQPKVNSVIVRLTARRPRPFRCRDEVSFKHIVASLFTQRNRKVRTAILPYLRSTCMFSKEKATRKAGVLPFRDVRVRELTPKQFGALANAIID